MLVSLCKMLGELVMLHTTDRTQMIPFPTAYWEYYIAVVDQNVLFSSYLSESNQKIVFPLSVNGLEVLPQVKHYMCFFQESLFFQ